MALKESGIRLVVKDFQAYKRQLQEINKLNKQAFSGSLGSYTSDINKATNEQKKFAKSTNEAWDVVDNLRRTMNSSSGGGSSGLAANVKSLFASLSQIKSSSGSLFAALKSMNVSGAGASFGALTTGATGLRSALTGLMGGVGGAGSAIAALAGPVGIAIAVFTALVGVASKAYSVFKEFAAQSLEVATRNETLAVSLNEVGKQAGYSQNQIDLSVELLKDQGITTQSAQQSLLRMARANISFAEATKLAAIAQGSAVVANMNSSDAFDRLVTGIQKMEPELLDELGITLRRTEAYDKFAKQQNLNVKSLTEQQKQQAILNEIYEQSEAVVGVYDAAMSTSGKQMGSLTRHVEEAQASFGKLLLPFQELKVAAKTDFWKALRESLKGLEAWAPIIREVLNGIVNIGKQLLTWRTFFPAIAIIVDLFKTFTGTSKEAAKAGDEVRSVWDRVGEAIFNAAKLAVYTATYIGAAFTTTTRIIGDAINAVGVIFGKLYKFFMERTDKIWSSMKDLGKIIIEGWGYAFVKVGEIFNAVMDNIFGQTKGFLSYLKELAAQLGITLQLPDFGFAESIELVTKVFNEELGKWQKSMDEKFPDLAKSWEEFTATAEGTAEDLRLPIDEATDGAAQNKDEIEALIKVYEKLDDILRKFKDDVSKLNKERDKAISDFGLESQKQFDELTKKQQEKATDFEAKATADRKKLVESYQKNRVRQEQETNRKLEQERRRFELQQLQSKRRFELQDRRLRSEGDILALMDLRENYELEKQEAKENQKLQQQEQKESGKVQSKQQEEDFKERLAEFDAQTEEQRQTMKDSFDKELQDFRDSRAEQFEELKKSFDDRYNALIESRNKEIEELGRSMAQEKDVTKEGMEAIAEEIRAVFGEDAVGDALIQGWASRTESAFGQTIAKLEADLQGLEDKVKQTATTAATIGQQAVAPSLNYRRGSGYKGPRPVGMRHGGEGVVTGPAHFYVEPGVKEHFAFNPVSQAGSVQHSGRLDMGLNVSGLPSGLGQQLEETIINKSADMVINEITIAIDRLKRR